MNNEEMIKRIQGDFMYHPPKNDEQVQTYREIRSVAKDFAIFLISKTRPSREQSLALTKLEEVVMWANASIARSNE